MFFLMNETEFISYADDNTPYVASDNIDYVIKILENDSILLFKWFLDNQMKANEDKCHFTVSNNKHMSPAKLMILKLKSVNVKNYLEYKLTQNSILKIT